MGKGGSTCKLWLSSEKFFTIKVITIHRPSFSQKIHFSMMIFAGQSNGCFWDHNGHNDNSQLWTREKRFISTSQSWGCRQFPGPHWLIISRRWTGMCQLNLHLIKISESLSCFQYTLCQKYISCPKIPKVFFVTFYARWNHHKSFKLQVAAPLTFWIPYIFQAWIFCGDFNAFQRRWNHWKSLSRKGAN